MAEPVTKQITISVAGRPYPLKIKASDETTIRKVVKEVNEQVQQFLLNYPTKDKQDSLVMTILTYATDLHKIRQSLSTTQDPEIVEKLSALDSLLEEALM
jgi:cell division protein ZapA